MTDIVDIRSLQIIDLIKANRYTIYDLTEQELDRVLHQTYLRRNSFAMVVKVSEEDSWWGMYNRQYNECRLEYVPEPSRHWMNLTIYSIDDGMWRAILPLSLLNEDFNLESLWKSIKSWISPNLTQEYFREFTSVIFGATEFDWN